MLNVSSVKKKQPTSAKQEAKSLAKSKKQSPHPDFRGLFGEAGGEPRRGELRDYYTDLADRFLREKTEQKARS